MKLTSLSPWACSSIALPEKCAGHYRIRGRGQDRRALDILSVEAFQGDRPGDPAQWILVSNRRFHVLEKGRPLSSVVLEPHSLYHIESADRKVNFALYTEPLTADRKRYTAYKILGSEFRITIGRDRSNNIAYDNKFVSSRHAELTFTAGRIQVRDLGSANHTYVNGHVVTEADVKNGDVIFVVGLQIVVTSQHLYLNCPDGRVAIQCRQLQEYHAPLLDGLVPGVPKGGAATFTQTPSLTKAPEAQPGDGTSGSLYHRAPALDRASLSAPTAPAKPAAPATPAAPDSLYHRAPALDGAGLPTPAAPVTSATPATPAAPATPATPAAPATPATPATPGSFYHRPPP